MPDIKRRIIIDTKDVERAKSKADELVKKLDKIETERTKKAQSEARKRINQTRKQLQQGLVSEKFAARKIAIIRKNLASEVIAIEKKKQRRLEQIEKAANTRAKKSGKEISGALGGGFAGFKAIVGAGIITTATAQIIDLGGAAIDAAKNFELAEKGLRSTAAGFGQNAEGAIAAAKELSETGLLSFTQAAQGVKSLLGTGFDVSSALKISKGLVDIGAFNNIVGNLGDAFVDATKGIKCLDESYFVRAKINGRPHVAKIGSIFTQVEQLESVSLEIDQTHYLKKSTLEIPDENGRFQEVSAIIKKRDEIVELTFDSGYSAKVGSLHKFRLNKFTSKLAVDVKEGDVFTLVNRRVATVRKIENHNLADVFGFQIETPEHLYSTNDGIIHHNTNSIELIENIGLTTRLGSALQKQGFTQEDLTDKNKKGAALQALQNILLKDAAKFTGDAAKFAETYAGAQARLDSATTRLSTTIGRDLTEALAPVVSLFADFTRFISDFIGSLSDGTRKALLFAGVITPVVAGLGAFLLSLKGLSAFIPTFIAAAGPLGLFIAAVTAVGIVFAGVVIAIDRFKNANERSFRATQKQTAALIKEAKAADALAKKTNLTAEEKKRLAIANGKLRDSAIDLGIAIKKENGELKTNLELARDIAKAKFVSELQKTVREIDDLNDQIDKLSGKTKGKTPRQLVGTGGGVSGLQRIPQIERDVRKLEALKLEIEKQIKDIDRVLTPGGGGGGGGGGGRGRKKGGILFTEDQLKAELAAIRRAQNEKNTISQQAELRQREITIQGQLETLRSAADLTTLENERIILAEELKEKAITKARKKELKQRLRLNALDIKEGKRKLAVQARDEQAFQKLRADLATSFVDFTEKAFLSEKISFKSFLADSIKLFAKFIADKIKLSALADLADPFTVPIGIAKLAAAGAVQALGSAAASALAPQETAPELSFDSGTINERLADRIDDLKQPVGGPAVDGPQVVNIDNSVNVNLTETGTYYTESQAIRERIAPLLDEVRVEQGTIEFAG